MVFIGTAYFVNEISAVKYYAKQDVDEESVKEYIKDGLVYIGKPSISPDTLLSIDEDGRYWINE